MKRQVILVAVLSILVPGVWLPGATARSQSDGYAFTTLDVNFPSSQEELFGCTATGLNDLGLFVGACNDSNKDAELRGYLYDGRRYEVVDFSKAKTAPSSGLPVQNAVPWRSQYQRSRFYATSAQPPSILNSMRPVVTGVSPQEINNWGHISGSYFDGTRVQGFLKRSGNVLSLAVPNSIMTEAVGLNDGGKVVGDYRSQDGVFHGFVYDGQTYATLDFPAGGDTGAAGVNNFGQIVGCYSLCGHGFLYRPKTASFVSIDVPGALATQASGINDLGHIVGNYVDGTGLHGFFYDGATFTTIDAPGAILTDLFRINNFDQIVGFYVIETSPGVFEDRAFVASR